MNLPALNPTAGPGRARWPVATALALALLLTAVPLFVGLDRWDLRNDETIYSYAVDRILETGNWLTPQSIPTDGPFLEKPPLKFWLVAGAMKLHLLPQNELGMRMFDAIFGTVAFTYIFLIGWRLGGVVCGGAALIFLFAYDPLIFDHGLRSNNMDGALFLAYCGSVFHFDAWIRQADPRRRRGHALAVGLYFVLGFMTKFVAMVFFPMLALIAMLWQRDARPRIWRDWREWVRPVLVAAVLILPWFIYQALVSDGLIWADMFGAQVYQRFTTYVDPAHLKPWFFYFRQNWIEFALMGVNWVTLVGLALFAWRAIARTDWLSRLVLLWAIVPLTLISMGSSKLLHYSYPFIPPFALAFGLVVALLVQLGWLVAGTVQPLGRTIGALTRANNLPALVRRALAFVALGALVIAGITWAAGGRIHLETAQYDLLRNSSVARPLIAGVVVLVVIGYTQEIVRSAIVFLLLLGFTTPLQVYRQKLEKTLTIDRPLHALRDCMLRELDSGRATARGVVVDDREVMSHQFFYYMKPTGPWVKDRDLTPQVRERIFGATESQEPVLTSRPAYLALRAELGRPVSSAQADLEAAANTRHVLDSGLIFFDGQVILLPPVDGRCRDLAVSHGGTALQSLTINSQ